MANTLTKVTMVYSEGRRFYILKDEEKRFWAVEDKYIQKGKLTKELNGLSGMMSSDCDNTIQMVINLTKVEKFVSQGMDLIEAMKKVMNERFGVNNG